MPPSEPPPDRSEPVPTWARVLDAATVVTFILAALIYASGGFREYVGPVRVSVRSWERLAALALLLTAVRHGIWRHPWIGHHYIQHARRYWASEERRAVLPAYVGTRVGTLLVGYLAVATIGFLPGTELFRVSEHTFANLAARWDAAWYLSIVQEGYQWDGDLKRQQNVVFFPAFPLLMRALGSLMGQRWLDAGLLIALTAFLIALTYLYRLGRDLMDADRARTAVWTLAAYPFAVYYSAAYTESLYLLGAVGVFYHAGREQWWRAAAWGFFLSLCRPNGFFIAAPVGIMVLQHAVQHRRFVLSAWVATLSPACGVLLYCLYLYSRFGDPLVWMKGQAAWGRVFVGFVPSVQALFLDRYQPIAQHGLSYYAANNPYDFMYTATAIFMLACVWPSIRRFGLPYGVFTLINILPPLVMGGMMSIGRMTAVLFPAFLVLGAVLPSRHTTAWVAASCILQGLIAVLFYTWRPVF